MPSVNPPLVLIVDDELDILMPLTEVLQKLLPRCSFYPAQSAAEALEFLGRQKADLVITDLRMPGLDGEQFLGIVREMGTRPEAILMTAYPQSSPTYRCIKEKRVATVITKPFDATVMAQIARSLLSKHKLDAGAAA